MVAPGVAISLSVLAANILGDALRDAVDPRRARTHSNRPGTPSNDESDRPDGLP
jgi:hypothetical protein